nr:reverse transcriptase domain-containing protein [Tanacetum cinerariifolium]
MRTRSNFYPSNSSANIPRRSNRRRIPNIVEPEIRTIAEIILMADRTMEELLQAPTEGDVPNDAIKLMLFSYSLEDRARIWDVVSKSDDRIDKLADQISNLVEIVNKQVIALAQAVEKTCVTCGGAHAYYECIATDRSTAQVQLSVMLISILEPDVPMTQSKPSIPYPSRLNDQKLREKATNQMEKFFQIFHDLHFDISFADALLLMPKFASTIKSLLLLANKDKLFELAKVSLNENCSAMLLKKLPERLGDPGKFLIPCEFPRMNVCHALADLGASINLMPLSIWKKLSLPELTPTWMTLELADRVPLILGRSFLRIDHALIDIYGEEITLRVNDESVTFNLDQVMRYSDNSLKRVNVINIASEEVVHDNTKSGNPTLVYESDFCEDPIVKTSPFGENPCQLPPINLNHAKSPIEEPEYSFSMGYEHFITTPVMELDEVTESSDKNLVPIQSKFEVTSNDESEFDEPINDDSSSSFTTFTNPLFDDKDDFTIHDEDVLIEESKVYSNPLFDDDEINSNELESHCLNVESNFVESLSNHDTLKFDHLEEFSGALMPIHIAEEERIRKEYAEYISLMERLITINPRPRPMVNANTIVESLPLSLIPIQDNDSQREEIDVVTDTDELLPLSFKNDDSEGKIYVLEELRVDNSISNSKNELADFNQDDPLFPRPHPEPPDAKFDVEPNSREMISVVMNTIDELNKEESLIFLQMLKMMITFSSYLSFEFFYHISSSLRFFLYISPLRARTPFLTLAF